MRIDPRAIVAIAALAVSSCAETGAWQNKSIPEERWSKYEEECNRFARKRSEEEFALVEQAGRGSRNTRSGNYLQNMDRFEAGKKRDDLFERCMTQQGFTRAPKTEKK